MTEFNYARLQEWFGARNKREKILIILVGMVIIYSFWYLLLSRPLLLKQRDFKNEILRLQTQTQAAKDQVNTILTVAKKYSINEKLLQQRYMADQSQYLKQRIDSLLSTVISRADTPVAIRDVLNLQSKDAVVVHFQKLSEELFISKDLAAANVGNKQIRKVLMQLEVQGSFLGTLNYLYRLEKLPWHLYWDSLSYQVMTYPKASVVITFYVLVE